MKNIKTTFLIVCLIPFVSFGQGISESVGTWQAVAFTAPTLYNYNKETKQLLPLTNLKNWLASTNKEINELAEATIKTAKTELPKSLESVYLEINEDKSFKWWIGNKLEKNGPCSTFIAKTEVPFDVEEDGFIRFVENYKYGGGLKLTTIYKDDVLAHFNYLNNEKTIIINYSEVPINLFETARAIFILKKVSPDKAAELKQNQLTYEQNKKNATEKADADKVKVDIETKGEIYTNADKEPVILNELETKKKILTYLFEAATENGANNQKFVINVSFVVEKDGSISNIMLPNEPGYGIKNAIIKNVKRFVKATAAERNGQTVRFKVTKDYSFTYTNND